MVKLLNVHAEAVGWLSDSQIHAILIRYTKLSPHEQIPFDAVREVNPRTENEWAKVGAKIGARVNAKWPRDAWRKVVVVVTSS